MRPETASVVTLPRSDSEKSSDPANGFIVIANEAQSDWAKRSNLCS